MDIDKTIDKKLLYWKEKLIDLSKRNNLVSYRFTKSKSIKIIPTSFENIIEDLNQEKNVLFLKKKMENPKERQWLCSENEEVIEKKLYTLYLKAKENFQELGVSTCFVSLGMLKYKDVDHSEIFLSAPIFLYPVKINRLPSVSKDTYRFEITSSPEDLQLNPALKEKLIHDFGIEIKEFEIDKPAKEYLEYLKEAISGMKNWEINEEVYLDIFSYQKYVMYQDLKQNEDLVKKSPLVRAYVGDRNALQDEIAEAPREEFDDTTDIDVFPADSSQKRAIELAKAGVTFVLQGPPGTGKSQTICNIIASLIERKKKILFVSQKMAALDVVQKRLNEVGLGRYCLNLHEYKGEKKEIVRQLMTQLITSPIIKDSAKRYSFANYLEVQNELNEFYKYLGEKNEPRNLSIYEIRGELAKLHSIEIINSELSDCLNYNEDQFSNLIGKLSTIDNLLERVVNPLKNIYFNFDITKNTRLSRDEFRKLLDETHGLMKEIIVFLENLNESTDYELITIEELKNFSQIHDAVKKLKKIPKYLISNKFYKHKNTINELYTSLTIIENLRKELLKNVSKEFLDIDTKKHEKIFKETSFFARLTNKEYKNSKEELKKYAKNKLSHNDWVKIFELNGNYKKQLSNHEQLKRNNSELIKNAGDTNNLENLRNLNQTVDSLSSIYIKVEKINKKFSFKIVDYMFVKDSISESFNKLLNSFNKINSYFIGPKLFNYEEISQIKNEFHSLLDNLIHLDDVLIFKKEYKSLSEEIKKFMQEFLSEHKVSKFSQVFLKSYYLQLLEQIQKKLTVDSPKNEVEFFREKDFEVRDMKRFKVMDSIKENQPSYTYKSSGQNEVYILKRENEKKRRLKPIRDLLEQIPNLAFSVKPCFMMSPLTVSQYINPKSTKFDVVIFDEASQIMPEDAVPCLIRANQAIVMGDTQQLPPTSFFLRSQDDEFVEEEIEDLESFLSEASINFRSKSLDWHYRSKNETLIAFSNRFFYENRLVTFPNPNTKDKSGLEFVYVKNGIYDRGGSRKNRIEAKELVEVYRKLKKLHPKESFGIIAFSIAQEDAIREAFQIANINIEGSIDPHTEELFIKNLETVQGDERDIIILSVGYGKDSRGILTYHFGPLNKEGGYKRLNVAVTRSRFKTVVISSILPEELDENKIHVDGVRYLKHYLDYSKNKDFGKFLQISEELEFDSTFEEVVYNALVNEGFSVNSQVGCSGYRVDLAIKHPKKPGEYILGIECDGAQYHSSRFARDRDKVRQEVLKSLGWNIHRIWSEDWLNNREHEIELIKKKINDLLKTNKESEVEERSFPEVELKKKEETSLKSKYDKYKIAELPGKYIKFKFDKWDRLRNSYDVPTIKIAMLQVLEIESPIEKELLFKRVLHSFGIQKLGIRINNIFESILRKIKESQDIYIYQNTISTEPIKIYCQVRISKEQQRPFTLIPKEELAGAIIEILKNTFSISKDALIKDIAKEMFYNNRTGWKIENKMNKAIGYLIEKKVIEEVDGKFRLIKEWANEKLPDNKKINLKSSFVCPQCGIKNEYDAIFCNECGAELKK